MSFSIVLMKLLIVFVHSFTFQVFMAEEKVNNNLVQRLIFLQVRDLKFSLSLIWYRHPKRTSFLLRPPLLAKFRSNLWRLIIVILTWQNVTPIANSWCVLVREVLWHSISWTLPPSPPLDFFLGLFFSLRRSLEIVAPCQRKWALAKSPLLSC